MAIFARVFFCIFHECTVSKISICHDEYRKYSAKEAVAHKNQQHLTIEQREQLIKLLENFEEIFEGRPGTFKGLEVTFDLKEGARPFYGRPYSIPEAYKDVFKRALQQMVNLDVLERTYDDTAWASPTFGVPKKGGEIRIVSDFRQLNRAIKRSPWPMPTIRELLHDCGGLTFATALDQIMGYWGITMAECIRHLLTIITPFGKYKYKKITHGS